MRAMLSSLFFSQKGKYSNELLDWIESFEKESVFWDIGANIGLYSIYNALKNVNSSTISFEPSSSNLRILSRNIYINNLQNKIKIIPLPLTNKPNNFLKMNEADFIEGGALNTFGETYNFEGKNFENKMSYQTLGTTINYLIDNKILEVPDYIKIDVDGIEHLILKGGNKLLKNTKSVLVENSNNFFEQTDGIKNILHESGLKLSQEIKIDPDYTNQIWKK